jgi:hypothetical protein
VTGALLDKPISRSEQVDRPEGGRMTLERLLSATLEIARANGSSECPMCHARVRPVAHAAECGGCGSRLS